MTQYELIARVNHQADTWEEPMAKALRAVFDLHFSIIAEQESLEGYPMACHHCNVLYPCPTIQAIEKELK